MIYEIIINDKLLPFPKSEKIKLKLKKTNKQEINKNTQTYAIKR